MPFPLVLLAKKGQSFTFQVLSPLMVLLLALLCPQSVGGNELGPVK